MRVAVVACVRHASPDLLIACVHIRAVFQEELYHAGVAAVGIRRGCPVNRSLFIAEAPAREWIGSRGEREQGITLSSRCGNIFNALTRRAGSHQPWQAKALPQQEGLYFQQQHAVPCPSP